MNARDARDVPFEPARVFAPPLHPELGQLSY
jgi:hypothetical protein